MNIIIDGFVCPAWERDKRSNFLSSDSREVFNQRQKEEPHDWYYLTHPIEYHINRYGHRSPNPFTFEKHSDYILVTGCSITAGIGLEYSTMWATIVSKKLNLPYYNLALGGSDQYTMMHNLINWLWKYPKPRYLVIQWPDTNRILTGSLLEFHNVNTRNLDVRDTMIKMESIGAPQIYRKVSQSLFREDNDMIVTDLIYDHTEFLIDNARDYHPGILSNQLMAKAVLAGIDKYTNESS